jgi:hypothetical protein
MIRQGLLCRNCTVAKCSDKGTDDEPISIDCPTCNRKGCDHCDDVGFISILGCPNVQCGDVSYVARLADLFEKGMPPIAGGALDQSAWFLDAVSFLRSDEAQLRAKSDGE